MVSGRNLDGCPLPHGVLTPYSDLVRLHTPENNVWWRRLLPPVHLGIAILKVRPQLAGCVETIIRQMPGGWSDIFISTEISFYN